MKMIWTLVIVTILTAAGTGTALAADAPDASAERIAKLVADLGADSYIARQEATEELVRIGKPAITALEKATASGDAEVRMRATKALAEIRKSDFERASDAVAKQTLWKTPIAGGACGSPVLVGGNVAVACWDDHVRLFDAKTGKLAGEVAAEAQAGVAADGKRVFFKGADGKLAAIDAATGKAVEGFAGPSIAGVPAAAGGMVYAAGADKTFLAMAGGTGKTTWSVTLPDAAVADVPPAVGDGIVCVVTGEGVVRALAAADGKEKWSSNPVAEAKFVSVAAGKVMVHGRDGLTAFASEDGKRAWTWVSTGEAGAAGGMAVAFKQQVIINGKNVALPSADAAGKTVAVADGVAYLTAGEKLLALTAEGKEKWSMTPALPKDEKKDAGGAPGVAGGNFVVAGGGKAQIRIMVAGNVGGGANFIGGPGGGKGLTGPAVHEGVVYVGGPDGLHAVDLASQAELWKLATPAPVAGRPVVADGVIYFATFRPGQLAKGAEGEDGPCVYAVKVAK